MSQHRVAGVDEIEEGTGREVMAGDQVVALFRVNGQFYALDGVCPHEAPFPVYRLYNRHHGETLNGVREDSNHRFTTLSSVYYGMGLRGWAMEGIVMCAQGKP